MEIDSIVCIYTYLANLFTVYSNIVCTLSGRPGSYPDDDIMNLKENSIQIMYNT